ncbi:PQQ-binding-like beta-propeller repeat protein [Mycobacterium ulcerans]|uniref:outer membrane protein assembly factor BamB family protein n=1 Tax=Mycobacterium ulcerans TaxID=1809 RepID=UPI0008F8A755|nr:PQQ-binding-like beta-propeller repeat protein [Mycobacterium ulcerans]MEB3906075.1 PQQ-binding-like beta-propeller repeat protein [Mycobacterium ulcerans]MEB3910252.1 PQQ-binding-like beta-propeller repeat protein [Mycobacterium ulcerans]MEB3920501.1 PQQ-binding-like beta-propeller repeat protein [Mycobacterium ulcerans]MEB3924583.1 PQQ-binding-like beta-propeller repeat protein [Mycobacterium ulcerans]MEB3928767.1 PQQ-binding-like beta-propeller repeat protein [Mycobacterium ulcerans]
MGTLRNHPVFARRLLTTALAAALTIGLGGCGNTDSWVDVAPALGWPAQYSDAANSSYTTTAGSSKLALKWTRSVKGSLAAGPALSGRGYLALNSQTPAGCSLMEWENNDNGRQRWCVRLVQGGGFAGPLFDGFDNLYVGQPGAIVAFPVTQWTRWRQPVIGMPSTPRFLGNGHLLVATHLGQMLVFDAHRGKIVGSPMDLVEGVDPTDPARGLADCAPARQGCPVAAAPAFSKVNGMVVVGIWQPGAPAAGLVGLKYHAQQLVREWTSDAVKDGVLASPVLSADGETVYVNGRDQRLWALHATDGKVKWSVPLGFLAQTPPTVTPEGLIVSGGGPDTRLAAFRDAGDHAYQAWRRDDVAPLSTSSLAAGNVGYTIVAGPPHEGGPGMSLLVFNPADGHTINSYSLPAATGYPVGVSIAVDGRVVTATSDGQVYSFAPA